MFKWEFKYLISTFFIVDDKIIKMKYLFIFLFLFFSFQQKAWSEKMLTEFLIAKPDMPDPRFKETVIVMLYHISNQGKSLFSI